MIRYEASIPRAACGMAAIAMTALVFGLAVVLPRRDPASGMRSACATTDGAADVRYGRM